MNPAKKVRWHHNRSHRTKQLRHSGDTYWTAWCILLQLTAVWIALNEPRSAFRIPSNLGSFSQEPLVLLPSYPSIANEPSSEMAYTQNPSLILSLRKSFHDGFHKRGPIYIVHIYCTAISFRQICLQSTSLSMFHGMRKLLFTSILQRWMIPFPKQSTSN